MMPSEKKDLFSHKSKSWDMNSRRVKTAQAIANAIVSNIPLHSKMRIMDFGAGTGLLSFFISQKVSKIIAVDTSASMLEVFKEKSSEFLSQTEILNKDLTKESFDNVNIDGIISSMTLHHIEDIPTLFKKFYTLLPTEGFIALADLKEENGTFHSDNQGVFHYGFSEAFIQKALEDTGFKEIQFHTPVQIQKPHGIFPLFLVTAYKRD